MKKILYGICLLVMQQAVAQKSTNIKWHRLVVGGKNSYFTKTHVITDTVMIEDQFGTGDIWDNSPMEIKVANIVTNSNEERIITKYGDSLYAVIIFKNITDSAANVCYYSNTFATITAAQQYKPDENSFFKWYTTIGYEAEMAKPVMPTMTKNDVIDFAKYYAGIVKQIKENIKNTTGDEKTKAGLAMAMILNAVPTKYASIKGYNSYKSLAVIEKGLKTFGKDKEVIKYFETNKSKK
ncbi:hypothetical protein ACFOWM_07865 [Ferruginibacter yonginensis]|uniref:DUF4468 domain-containing protein n=1 Tax=Ferruginibacter yonginensis TaxID=1310416 RepID=A0ABV8QSZ3_9BACT